MARQIERLVPATQKYPWHKYTNGEAWQAKKGRDFACSPLGFKNALHAHANRKGFSVTTAIKGDAVEFQFRKRRKRKTVS